MPSRRPLPLILLLLLAVPAAAQDRSDQPALPDIAPQEVEIRGQLEIAFPSLQRQPLIGFNPPPRVIEIPADRQPYVEAYKQDKADLPPSPLIRPAPPTVSPLAGKEPINGAFEAAAGRYFTRTVNARGRYALSRDGRTAAHGLLDYAGTDGHTPYAETDPEAARASFNNLDARIGVKTTRRALALGADVDGFLNTYTLFGAEVGTGAPVPFALEPQPDRTGSGLGAAAWLRAQGTARTLFDLRARVQSARFETDVARETDAQDDVEEAGPAYTQQERRLDLEMGLEHPFSAGDVRVDAIVATSRFDADGEVEHTATALDGGAAIRLRHERAYSLTIGARFLAFVDEAGEDGSERRGYLSPAVRFETYPGQGKRLYAENRPGVDPNGLVDVYRANPYVVDEPQLQPTLRVIDAEGGGSLFIGPVQLAARAGFQYMPNYLYFENATQAASGGYRRGFFVARYDRASIAHAGGDVSIVLPAGFHATAGATVRRGRLTENDTEIPYFGPVTGQAMLSYSFSRSRGLVQLVGSYERARYVDRTETRKVGDFFDLDVRGSYEVAPSISLTAALENLSARRTRWDFYPLAPVVFTAGIRMHW